MNAQAYFRICLFVPLLVPLPFLIFKGDEGLSSMFMAQLVFGIPPYVLVFVLPLVFLFGRMSERQIVMGVIFFPIVYPLVFGLFWSVVPNFISTITITLSNTSQWVFTSIMFPAAYSMLFLSGNIVRKMLSREIGLLEQRVAAILYADIKTIIQSMDKDHGDITKRFSDYQEPLDQIINEHRGQRTNRTEDNVIVEFTSVLNAVKCGMSLQDKFKEINKEQSLQDEIHLGIGINLGEVKSKGNDIRGLGVSVATCLEDLAKADDICISGTVYDRIKRKLIFNYEYLGEQTFQAIDGPVRVYRLKLDAAEPKPEKVTEVKLTIPDKPSIAVLPFDNMSADPEQGYFSDGITEDIITDLSKVSGLFVISRYSTFVYKGKSVSAQQVSQDLGVRYILEGSVRKAGNRIRITAKLIDATTDDHIWADRFDRELDDIFEVQEEVSRKIASTLEIKINSSEEKRLGYYGTDNIEAYDACLHAQEQLYIYTPDSIKNATKLFSRSIELDPNYAQAYAWKSRCLILPFALGRNLSLEETVIPALVLARKAVELDDLLPLAHAILAWALKWNKEIEQAISEGKRAVTLDPNFAEGYIWLSTIYSSVGKGDEALESFEKAIRLNPYYGVFFLMAHGLAYFVLGHYEKALSYFTKGVESSPNYIPNHIFITLILGLLDREEKAHASADKLVKLSQNYADIVTNFFIDKQMVEISYKGLKKAGLKV